MVIVEVLASYELRRYLNAIAQPWDKSRRWAEGHWWERREGGEWATNELVPEGAEARIGADGRRPGVVIADEIVQEFSALPKFRPSQSDVDALGRGCEAAPATNEDGSERVDYNLPLKNKDGSLSRQAKELVEMHAPSIRREREVSEKIKATVTAQMHVNDSGKVVRRSRRQAAKKWVERVIERPDGTKATLRRTPGGVVVAEDGAA